MLRSSILLLICTSSVWAREISFTVDGAADYALEHNPTLAAARLRIEEARGRLDQSGRLSNPELGLEFTRNLTTWEGSVGLEFMQKFPLTARLRYEKAVSRAEFAAAEAEVHDAERKLSAAVRIIAVKLLALRGQRELRGKQLQNSRDLSTFLVKRVETGEASVVDASQVELETRQVEIESLQLTTEEVALVGEMRPLLGVTGGEGVKIIGVLSAPKSSLDKGTTANRPDIQAAKARANAATSASQQQRASRWEDIGVGALYSNERVKDEPEPIEYENVIGFKVSIPLPIWNNNSGRIREADAAAIRAAKEVDAAKLIADTEATAARDEMAVQAKLVAELDSAVLPKAGQIEDQLRNNYSTGQTPLTEVLRARSRRLELERLRIDALRDYHLARVRHLSATASTPSTLKKPLK